MNPDEKRMGKSVSSHMKKRFTLIGVALVAGGWAISLAQDAPKKPVVPAIPAKPRSEELKSPDLSKPADDQLRSLIEDLTKKMKPVANAIPSRTKSGFVEDEELILRLATEVLLLRERVEKLERK